MHRSVKANGQVALPHFPRTHRLPREMTPVEPAVFAAELIARLQKVKQQQETQEERLQQITEEEEREDCETPFCFQPPASCEEDPQAILDEHLLRVLQTPGCQSPPGRSRSPARSRVLPAVPVLQSVPCPLFTKNFVTKQTTKHVHHHYIHHHAVPQVEAVRRVQCQCTAPADHCCYLPTRTRCRGSEPSLLHTDTAGSRSGTLSRRKVISEPPGDGGGKTTLYQLPGDELRPTAWQRVAECENERPSKRRSHSAQNIRRNATCETTRASSAERPARHYQWSAPTRSHQPPHPPVLDMSVVAINTLAQLEEACRRLAEVSRPKQRCPSSCHQRSHSVPCPVTGTAAPEQKEVKSLQSAPPPPSAELTVTYFFCGEEIPYRRMLRAHGLTLGHFKDQLSKKGNYRYYFKKASLEFDCGAVFEEICDDATILPLYEGRVLGKVERIDV
ncbi:LOW QUALITY PROTEIN: axin-2 [Anomaloglossus baeobatrachus]